MTTPREEVLEKFEQALEKHTMETDLENERGGGILHIHKRVDPFVRIDLAIAENKRLTYQARGMMLYLLSKPEGWIVRMRDLINESPVGEEAVQAIVKELEKEGYIVRHKEQDAGGRWQWITKVCEVPVRPTMGG